MTWGKPYIRPPRPSLMPPVEKSRAVMRACALVSARPKFEYVRSPALMKAYRLLSCRHCGVRDGTVCGAHSNWAEHGKGRGIKASDIYCASLCFTCHSWLDAGGHDLAEQRRMWDQAHMKTMYCLISMSQETGKEAAALRRTLIAVGLVK